MTCRGEGTEENLKESECSKIKDLLQNHYIRYICTYEMQKSAFQNNTLLVLYLRLPAQGDWSTVVEKVGKSNVCAPE